MSDVAVTTPPSDLFDLSGKTAVVTGSSRGIGRAIAERMAEVGARVVISSRKQDKCEEVAQGILARGGTALAVPCHIGEREQLEGLVAESRRVFGSVDVLVCNAAVNPHFGSTQQIPDSAFDKVMGSNIRSAHWLCQMVIPEMAERRDGAVIIISSIAGLRGSVALGAYAISKAADMQMARNLAVEWGRSGVRVNCIAPGLVRTDFARALWENPGIHERLTATIPLGRLGDPDDIAGVALMLAAPAGRYITGQTIVVDGGLVVADAL
jgi:NAD(P)-dependent dehydrogenase (short-subunit alcohol dehydrogenase family)